MAAQEVIPFINGVQPDWSWIDINLLGYSPTAITSISWSKKRSKKNRYGKGGKVNNRAYGNYEYSAKLGMENLEWENIQEVAEAAGYDSIIDIPPFPIIVKQIKKGKTKQYTHVLTYAEFVENKRDFKQGEEGFSTELELIIADVQGG